MGESSYRTYVVMYFFFIIALGRFLNMHSVCCLNLTISSMSGFMLDRMTTVCVLLSYFLKCPFHIRLVGRDMRGMWWSGDGVGKLPVGKMWFTVYRPLLRLHNLHLPACFTVCMVGPYDPIYCWGNVGEQIPLKAKSSRRCCTFKHEIK